MGQPSDTLREPTEQPEFVAHVRGEGKVCQSLESHLYGVGQLTARMAEKFGLSAQGRQVGEFQAYRPVYRSRTASPEKCNHGTPFILRSR